jgi:hypothetical protein
MRHDGDEYRHHDDECSLSNLCAACEADEQDRSLVDAEELCCAADGWGDLPHAHDCLRESYARVGDVMRMKLWASAIEPDAPKGKS